MPSIGEVTSGVSDKERDEILAKHEAEVERKGYEELSRDGKIFARFYTKTGVLQLNVSNNDLEKITEAIGPIPKKGVTINLPYTIPGGINYENVKKIERLDLENNSKPEKLDNIIYKIDVGLWYIP